MTFYNQSIVQHYAIKMTDCAEYYFRGNRCLESKRNYLLKTIRILSFGTLILPIIFACSYLIANYLIKTNDSVKDYWKNKIIFPYSQGIKYTNINKETVRKIRELFLRSGITETVFDKIVIVTHGSSECSLSFTNDGKFSQFFRDNQRIDTSRILTLSIIRGGRDFNKSERKKGRSRMSTIDRIAGMTYGLFCGSDWALMMRWTKLPNEVKWLLKRDPKEKTVYN